MYIEFRLPKHGLKNRIESLIKDGRYKFNSMNFYTIHILPYSLEKLQDNITVNIRKYPSLLSDIVVENNKIINDKWYDYILPDYSKYFKELLNLYFEFTDLIIQGVLNPNKYSNIIKFINDMNSERGVHDFIYCDKNMAYAFYYLKSPPYYCTNLSLKTNISEDILSKKMNRVKNTIRCSKHIIDIMKNYNDEISSKYQKLSILNSM